MQRATVSTGWERDLENINTHYGLEGQKKGQLCHGFEM
jgi:hypothetical protein